MVVAIALVFGLVIYPKIAFNKDGEVVPPGAPHLTSVTESEGGKRYLCFYAAWTAPENDGDRALLDTTYIIKIEDQTYSYKIIKAETTVVVSDIASPGNYTVWVAAINDSGEGSISNYIGVTLVGDNKDEIDFDGDVSVSVTDTTMTIDWGRQKSRLQLFIMDLPKIFLLPRRIQYRSWSYLSHCYFRVWCHVHSTGQRLLLMMVKLY